MPLAQKTTSKKYSLAEASNLLGISAATLKNWIQAGLIYPKKNGSNHYFNKNELQKIKTKIETGEIAKLRKRANKNFSQNKHGHLELLKNKTNEPLIRKLLGRYTKNSKSFLLALYLVQLNKKGLCFFKHKNINFNSKKIENEIQSWNLNYESPRFVEILNSINNSALDLSDNLLSFAYQYTCVVGAKQKAGAYYTPSSLIQKLIKSTLTSTGKILDPCCGSGNFLVESLIHLKSLGEDQPWDYVFGTDIDLDAVLIARANLTLASKGQADSVRHIKYQNALLSHNWNFKFQFVITNPPWGAKLDNNFLNLLKLKYPTIKSRESFSYFILAGMNLLESNGTLGFVLPDAFLNIKKHSDIRKKILNNYTIVDMNRCQEKFSGVFTKNFTLILKKIKPTRSSTFKINNGKSIFKRTYRDLLSDADCTISFEANQQSAVLLKLIEEQGKIYLKKNATWALGIVTGDNQKFLSNKLKPGFEPVYKGIDVFRFKLRPPSFYLLFTQEKLQQVAQKEHYRHPEKLIYRFICKELVFAIDRSGFPTLNSANIMIPNLSGFSARAVCGILNSKLAQFYYQKKFDTFKTLKGNLEKFPFPKPNNNLLKEIENIVTKLEKKYSINLYIELNELVMNLYGLESKHKLVLRQLTQSNSFHL